MHLTATLLLTFAAGMTFARRPSEIYVTMDEPDMAVQNDLYLRKDLMDLVPPVSGWPSIVLNTRYESELRVHVEKYSNMFRYLIQAERNSRLDPSILRRGLLALCLTALDSTTRLRNLIGQREVQYRQHFNDAVQRSMVIFSRPRVTAQFEAIAPKNVVMEFLHEIYREIVLSSETSADAKILLDRFVAWINYWKTEIRDRDTIALRRIINPRVRLYEKTEKIIKNLIKYRVSLSSRNGEKTRKYEKKLINQLSPANKAASSGIMVICSLLLSLTLVVV